MWKYLLLLIRNKIVNTQTFTKLKNISRIVVIIYVKIILNAITNRIIFQFEEKLFQKYILWIIYI